MIEDLTPPPPHQPPFRLRDVLFLPLGCLVRSSPLVALLSLAVAGLLVWGLANGLRVDIPGLSAQPALSDLTILNGYTQIVSPKGDVWMIQFEDQPLHTYTGLVRHASDFRAARFPMLTHDLLVTTGDYADPEMVRTSVMDHKFMWVSPSGVQPQGSIHLLHTVVLDETIYEALDQVRAGDRVRVSGYEILELSGQSASGRDFGGWMDAGCNTLLVTWVEVTPKQPGRLATAR